MANQAKNTFNKVGQQLKNEKVHINKTNNAKDETKAHFDHAANFKEYTEGKFAQIFCLVLKDVYVNDTYQKIKSFAKKEKGNNIVYSQDQYLNQLEKTFPKETIKQYNNKLFNSINTLKRYSFWNANPQQQQNKQQQQYQQYNQQSQKQNNNNQYNPQQNSKGWKAYFSRFSASAENINERYKQNLSEKKNFFQQVKDAKLKTWNYMLQNSVSKAKYAGKVSFKYILIGIFVFGFAYAIPKSISQYFATKAAISAQLQIENLKKENETLRQALSLLSAQNGKQQNQQ